MAVVEVEKRMIILESSDGKAFEVEAEVVMEMRVIPNLYGDCSGHDKILIPNVDSKILPMVIEYCNQHVHAAASGQDLKDWDADFVKVEHATLFDLILAANYLEIKGLLDLTCQTVADMIKGKTPQEIQKMFNLKIPFTPEEEEEIIRENQWAFE